MKDSVLVQICLLLLISSGLLAQHREPPHGSSPGVEASLELQRQRFLAPLVAGGVVSDRSGRPLSAIRAVVTKARHEPNQTELSTSREKFWVDGAFRFACESCTEMEIYFFKPGYHPRTIHVHVGGESPRLERTRLQVELEEAVAPVRLERYATRLIYRGDENDIVLRFGDPASGPIALKRAREKAQAGESLAFVRLESSLLGDGLASKRRQGVAWLRPPTASLDFSQGGGVQVYRPRGETRAEIVREMWEAPESGYGDRLVLDPQKNLEVGLGSGSMSAAAFEAQGEAVWFYCRVGDQFGRGVAWPPLTELTRDGRQVVVPVEIWLSPEAGSRRLESLE